MASPGVRTLFVYNNDLQDNASLNWHTVIMKATDTLGHATLADSLNAACYAITNAFIEGSDVLGIRIPGVPTSDYFDEFIPGLVLNLAVNAGWIAPPVEAAADHGVALGRFHVEEKYREWFIGLLDESLSNLREAVSENDNDEDAKQVRTELWNVLFESLGGTATGENESVGDPPTTAPPETGSLPMPEWGEAYKAAQVPETTPAERNALEQRYLSAHKHLAYENDYEKWELAWMADVHPKQWERWRRAKIANNSIPGRKILKLLERNQPTRDPRKIRERKREKLSL
jgi:hypothetical protein